MFGSLFSKSSKTSTQATSNDNRQVNDASNGGTVVSGSNNQVTDGGAFSIVDRLVTGVVDVAKAQTVAARDMGTGQNSGGLVQSAATNQAAALDGGGIFGLSANQTTAAMAGAAVLVVLLLAKVMK
jgi:hypothetical protein